MATDLTGLQNAIKLLADAADDALTSGGSATGFAKYASLLPDLLTLLPTIGEIPAEAAALQPSDYATLIASLAADLALPDAHVQAIVAAALKTLTDIATTIVPDIQALIAALQAAPAPAPAPAPASP